MRDYVNEWGDQANYTVKAAAVRVERDVRTIERWIQKGLHCRFAGRMIVIDHDDLMAFWRKRMENNPVKSTRRDGA